jgi:two-component system response regulator BaeR
MKQQHIMIIEDEAPIAEAVKRFLNHDGFHCTILHNGSEAVELVTRYQPDLIILDVMLPGGDGMEICRTLRQTTSVPIVLLTARNSESDRLEGLQAGADDYVCKPFSAPELVLRVKAILRRGNGRDSWSDTDALILDADTQHACLGTNRVELTTVEFALMSTLVEKPNRIFSRDKLMSVIYKDNRIVSDRTVDSHISKLRKKINAMAEQDELIVSVYGAGYKYTPPAQ